MEIRTLFSKNKKQFFYYVLGTLIITPSNIIITFALANLFNVFTLTSRAGFIKTLGTSLILAFTPIVLQFISRYLRIGFMRDVLVQVRLLAYDSLFKRTISDFNQSSIESYQAQLVSDINLFEKDFFLSILNIVYSFGNFILGIIVIFLISKELALLTVIAAFLLYLLTKVFEGPSLARKKEVLKENESFHKSLSNILNGLETIKLYRVGERFRNSFYKDLASLEVHKKSSNEINLVQKNIMTWVSGSYQLFTVVYAGYLFSQDRILLTSLILIFNLVGQLIWGMNHGFSMVNRFKTSKEIYYSISGYIEEEDGSEDLTLENSLEVKNLNFSYGEKEIFRDFNLSIGKNQKTLIFGPSGKGKTSLVNIISGAIADYEGQVLYDGIDLRKISRKSLSKKIAYVRQDHFIFKDSIKNNIILDKAYDEKKFIGILRDLGLYEWVMDLEKTWDHELINNGSNISGGQRQRVNIARELYQDKEFLIFDEPSSSLDDDTSLKIYKTIMNLNKTVLVISHRHLDFLSKNFDQLVDLTGKEGNKDGDL